VTVNVRDVVVVPFGFRRGDRQGVLATHVIDTAPEPVAVKVPRPPVVKLTGEPFSVAVRVLIPP